MKIGINVQRIPKRMHRVARPWRVGGARKSTGREGERGEMRRVRARTSSVRALQAGEFSGL